MDSRTRHNYNRHVALFSPSSQSLARHGNGRGRALLSGASDRDRRWVADAQRLSLALRFFFANTLDRAELGRHLARVHDPRKLPRTRKFFGEHAHLAERRKWRKAIFSSGF